MGVVNRRLDMFFGGGSDPWKRWGSQDDFERLRLCWSEALGLFNNNSCKRWGIFDACSYMAGLDGRGPAPQFLLDELRKHIQIEPLTARTAKVVFMGEVTRCDFDEGGLHIDESCLTFPIVAYYRFARLSLFPNDVLGLDVPCFFMFHDMEKEDWLLARNGVIKDVYEPLSCYEFLPLVSCLNGLNIHGVTVEDSRVELFDGYMSFDEIVDRVGVLPWDLEKDIPVIKSYDCVKVKDTSGPVQTDKCQVSVTDEKPTEVMLTADDVEILEGVTVKNLRKILGRGAPIDYVLMALVKYSQSPKDKQNAETLEAVLKNSAGTYKWGTSGSSGRVPSAVQIDAVKMLMFPVGIGGRKKDFSI